MVIYEQWYTIHKVVLTSKTCVSPKLKKARITATHIPNTAAICYFL